MTYEAIEVISDKEFSFFYVQTYFVGFGGCWLILPYIRHTVICTSPPALSVINKLAR
jgi:hypothetical protein